MARFDIDGIQAQLQQFAVDRDWEQFHSPKNLAMALSVEAAELLEVFQWLSEPESREISDRQLSNARDEAADVAIYLLRLADVLDIDLSKAIKDKIRMNEKKYPVARARGNAKKYTDFDQ